MHTPLRIQCQPRPDARNTSAHFSNGTRNVGVLLQEKLERLSGRPIEPSCRIICNQRLGNSPIKAAIEQPVRGIRR